MRLRGEKLVILSSVLNILGLFLDIIGVIVIFFFALPPMNYEQDRALIVEDAQHKTKLVPVSVYRIRAQVGLWLLIGGFMLQLLGNATVFWS